ncbi:hypothetical protein ACH4PU_32660 [Streptomyces sp. NPDC021100]|uniref:hypothetical protein n=1 Tax=Streptomyces sp. NPDC021100 TaxID=3365114 RepID=UPI0037B6ABBF
MTATHVNGISVLEDQPARSGISRTGVTVFYEQIRELLLEDGQVVYGCVHCDYTNPNQHSIRPHLKVHKPKATTVTAEALPSKADPATPRPIPAKPATLPATDPLPSASTPEGAGSLADLNLGQLVERARQSDQMRSERDAARREAADWKQRAAEERLRRDGWKQRALKAETGTDWKERAVRAERKLSAVRELLQS